MQQAHQMHTREEPPEPGLGAVVFAPGATVSVGPITSPIEATVLESCLSGGREKGSVRAQYKVSWWSGHERKAEWLESHEVRSAGPPRLATIGFRS